MEWAHGASARGRAAALTPRTSLRRRRLRGAGLRSLAWRRLLLGRGSRLGLLGLLLLGRHARGRRRRRRRRLRRRLRLGHLRELAKLDRARDRLERVAAPERVAVGREAAAVDVDLDRGCVAFGVGADHAAEEVFGAVGGQRVDGLDDASKVTLLEWRGAHESGEQVAS